ncbi:LysE family translocator [Roseovarius aestuarii]|uniref:Threonine efflux protein n=1 Tax=Roseovarius aestuarii TaxID=475083 RepID=A0A1X7BKP6_9RHOB|nr:LysE family translocator [Roseovarius aestuarii]SMC10225.1 Threonine efflux protein [Roseovarius aestuarii]
MSDHLASLFLALGIFSIGFISIGPNILAVIGTSMDRGRKQGAALALGVGIGSGIWATLTVAGLSALMTRYAGAMVVLKLVGAAYLLWLAWKAFRSAATPGDQLVPEVTQGDNLFWRGLTVQMTNPKAALHWIAIVSIGLEPTAPAWLGVALIVSATVISVLGHVAYAVTFSTRPVVAFYRRARRWISGGLGVFFTVAAVKLATDRG